MTNAQQLQILASRDLIVLEAVIKRAAQGVASMGTPATLAIPGDTAAAGGAAKSLPRFSGGITASGGKSDMANPFGSMEVPSTPSAAALGASSSSLASSGSYGLSSSSLGASGVSRGAYGASGAGAIGTTGGATNPPQLPHYQRIAPAAPATPAAPQAPVFGSYAWLAQQQQHPGRYDPGAHAGPRAAPAYGTSGSFSDQPGGATRPGTTAPGGIASSPSGYGGVNNAGNRAMGSFNAMANKAFGGVNNAANSAFGQINTAASQSFNSFNNTGNQAIGQMNAPHTDPRAVAGGGLSPSPVGARG